MRPLVILIAFLSMFTSMMTYAQQPIWQASIKDEQAWQILSKNERDAEFAKFVIDIKTNKIYFADAHVFKLHIDFAFDVLLKKPRTHETVKSFNLNYGTHKPNFILGYLTHYPKLNLWTYSFWEGDTIQAADVAKTQGILKKSFFVHDLIYRPDSVSQEKMAKGLKRYGIKVITNDKIYQKLPFQAFQTGQAVGRLRIISPNAALDTIDFATTDIVLLQEAYPDISPVAGIMTTQFSTPLSHVNLRASAWGIPNSGYKNGAQEFAQFDGKIVHYTVSESDLTMRLATAEEINQFNQAGIEKQQIHLPNADLTFKELKTLTNIRAIDVKRYGAKTANLGEIASAQNAMVNIPTGFGVPFYYYVQHIQKNHLQDQINVMLSDTRFKNDNSWRREQLSALKKSIIDAPIDSKDFAIIEQTWQKYLLGKGVFVRSSTNAEDLKGFNGAGLYDTVPNVKDSQALKIAIKTVWASIWNERAVNERNFSGINHNEVFPAVLIQTAVNATAAGVLLTTDIWGHNPNTYTINAKWGLGIRVVEGQKIPEQVLYDASGVCQASCRLS